MSSDVKLYQYAIEKAIQDEDTGKALGKVIARAVAKGVFFGGFLLLIILSALAVAAIVLLKK